MKTKHKMSVHFSSETDMWSTPRDFYDVLNKEFKFNLDPCATKENAVCKNFFTEEDDGLSKSWKGKRVFMNPPYGRDIKHWIKKAVESEALVVMLLPSRTDTIYFHEHIYGKCEIRFIKGRLKFGEATNSAPFPSMIVICDNRKKK